jgi:hypothetical protein
LSARGAYTDIGDEDLEDWLIPEVEDELIGSGTACVLSNLTILEQKFRA